MQCVHWTYTRYVHFHLTVLFHMDNVNSRIALRMHQQQNKQCRPNTQFWEESRRSSSVSLQLARLEIQTVLMIVPIWCLDWHHSRSSQGSHWVEQWNQQVSPTFQVSWSNFSFLLSNSILFSWQRLLAALLTVENYTGLWRTVLRNQIYD